MASPQVDLNAIYSIDYISKLQRIRFNILQYIITISDQIPTESVSFCTFAFENGSVTVPECVTAS